MNYSTAYALNILVRILGFIIFFWIVGRLIKRKSIIPDRINKWLEEE